MYLNSKIILFLLSSFALVDESNAFSSVGAVKAKIGLNSIGRCNTFPTMFGAIDDELEELENARTAFERLMQSEHSSFLYEFEQVATTCEGPNAAPPMRKEDYVPILTESCRRRREVEMELIASLTTSNDAIEELVNFWLVERDQESARKMKEMEQFCSPGHAREEAFLLDIIDEYGYHWVEPISRLALLYYADGRSAECEHWCKIALAVKPWHFEVVQTLIMNSMKQRDQEQAQMWMKQSLPPLEEAAGRKRWVERALNDARDALDRAQVAKKAAIKQSQLKRMTNVSPNLRHFGNDDFSDEAWQ